MFDLQFEFSLFLLTEMKAEYASIEPPYLKRSFEECVAQNNIECQFPAGENVFRLLDAGGGAHISQLMFFCGHEKHCLRLNDKKALRSVF